MMIRMDTTVRNLIEAECHRYTHCTHLKRAEMETLILGQLEASGKIMRYLCRDGRAVGKQLQTVSEKNSEIQQPKRPLAGWAGSVAYSKGSLAADLTRLGDAWRSVQSSRRRDAILRYLTDVFELVRWWAFENQANERAARALSLKGIMVPKKVEPYRAVIVSTVAPKTIDRRTVSKWSKALRFAATRKPRKKRLRRFIKEEGGINACAAGYSRRLRRQARD